MLVGLDNLSELLGFEGVELCLATWMTVELVTEELIGVTGVAHQLNESIVSLILLIDLFDNLFLDISQIQSVNLFTP